MSKKKWRPSKKAIDHIIKYEGFHVEPVVPENDTRMTSGYGVTDSDIVARNKGKKLTKEQGRKDLEEAISRRVDLFVKATPNFDALNSDQRDALFSYYYNIGHKGYTAESPSMQKALREKDWEGVRRNIDFDYNNPERKGARIRRDAEREMFLPSKKDSNVSNKEEQVGIPMDNPGIRISSDGAIKSNGNQDGGSVKSPSTGISHTGANPDDWYYGINPGINTDWRTAISSAAGIGFRLATGVKRDDYAPEYEENLWRAYTHGDISNLPLTKPFKDEDDDGGDYVGIPQEQAMLVQAIADVGLAKRNQKKAEESVYSSREAKEYAVGSAADDVRVAETIMRSPNEWILIKEGNSPYYLEDKSGKTTGYTGLGGLKNFSIKWSPEDGGIYIKDEYDFSNKKITEGVIPERDRKLHIRDFIKFDPSKGSMIFRGEDGLRALGYLDKYDENKIEVDSSMLSNDDVGVMGDETPISLLNDGEYKEGGDIGFHARRNPFVRPEWMSEEEYERQRLDAINAEKMLRRKGFTRTYGSPEEYSYYKGAMSIGVPYEPTEEQIKAILDKVNASKANFVGRLKQSGRKTMKDWESDAIATHKLGAEIWEDGKVYLYPNVQEIDGELFDFTDPKHGFKDEGRWDALNSAIKNNDYVIFDSIEDADWFARNNYKKYYPEFDDGGSVEIEELTEDKKKEIEEYIKSSMQSLYDDDIQRVQNGEQPLYYHSLGDKPLNNVYPEALAAGLGKAVTGLELARDYDNGDFGNAYNGAIYAYLYPLLLGKYFGKIAPKADAIGGAAKDIFKWIRRVVDKYIPGTIGVKEGIIDVTEASFKDGGETPNEHKEKAAKRFIDGWNKRRGERLSEYDRLSQSANLNSSKHRIISGDSLRWEDRLALEGSLMKHFGIDASFESDADVVRLAKENGISGQFNERTGDISYVGDPDFSTRIHENSHASRNTVGETPQVKMIRERISDGSYRNGETEEDEYLDSPIEIYPRLMEFRYRNSLDPEHNYTIDEIKTMRKGIEGKRDKDLLNRYDDEFMMFLLNEVADAGRKYDREMYAKHGGDYMTNEMLDNIFRSIESGEYVPTAKTVVNVDDENRYFNELGGYMTDEEFENGGKVLPKMLDAGFVDKARSIFDRLNGRRYRIRKKSGDPEGGFEERTLSKAEALAVLAHMTHESGMLNENALGDNGQSLGLGQWKDQRRDELIRYTNDQREKTGSNLTGNPTVDEQINFFFYELGNRGFQFDVNGKNLHREENSRGEKASSMFDYYQYSREDFLDNNNSMSDYIVSLNQGYGRPDVKALHNDTRLQYAYDLNKALELGLDDLFDDKITRSRYGVSGKVADGEYANISYTGGGESTEPTTTPDGKQEEKQSDDMSQWWYMQYERDRKMQDWIREFGDNILKAATHKEEPEKQEEPKEQVDPKELEREKLKQLVNMFVPEMQLNIKGITDRGG